MKRLILVLLLVFVFPYSSFGTVKTYTSSKIRANGDSDRIFIHLVGSGYGAGAPQTTCATNLGTLNTNLFATSGGSPDANPFYTKDANFTVWRTCIEADSDGTSISSADYSDTVAAAETANSFTSGYIIVRHNKATAGVQSYADIGTSLHYELGSDSNPYEINHEMAHLISYRWHTSDSGTNLVSIGDEYTTNGTCTGDSRYVFNYHDSLNDEKWDDVVAATPARGAGYCDRHLYRPKAACFMFDAATNVGFCPVCRTALTLAIEKDPQYPAASRKANNSPTIAMDVTDKVVIAGSYTGSKTITVNVAAVASGAAVYKVEWYISQYDIAGVYQTGEWKPHSIYVDKTGAATSTWVWNTYKYPSTGTGGEPKYSITVIVYDTYYNTAKVLVYGMSVTNPILGEGCTTAYVIDQDCDGYGVGSDLGPDADDTNGAVSNPFTLPPIKTTTYADIPTFLSTAKGITCSNYIFVDGNATPTGYEGTATGTRGTYTNADADPYFYSADPGQTWNQFRTSIDAGDCVIMRGGTYGYCMDTSSYPPINNCTEGNPCYIMAFPGEKFINSTTDCVQSNSTGYSGTHASYPMDYWTFDGMGGGLYYHGDLSLKTGDGFSVSNGQNNLTIREMELSHFRHSMIMMVDVNNLTIERNVFHEDYGDDHLIYIGSRADIDGDINTNITLKQNIFYECASNGAFQHNGRVTNLTVDSNIFHSNYGGGSVNILNGGTNVVVTNNVFFNNSTPINLYWYISEGAGTFPYGIVSFNFSGILIENNTIWKGTLDYNGAAADFPCIQFANEVPAAIASYPTGAYGVVRGNLTSYTSQKWAVPTTPNGCMYGVHGTGGTTGASEPAWGSATTGTAVTDGSVTWVAVCPPSWTGIEIRNNIFSQTGDSSDAVFGFTNDTWNTAAFINELTIEKNIIYRTAVAGTGGYLKRNSGPIYYGFTAFEAYDTDTLSPPANDVWKNNYNVDPGMVSIVDGNYASPWLYDIKTGSDADPLGNGSPTDIPTLDIKQVTRIDYDIGAYELGGGQTHQGITASGVTIQ